ncbi:response regulator transcription factor [Nocardioides sp. CFH 31398]|uniref:response regulator transcription factor n=1 Tax=Nocardioides sp. CFH 31398 TaxID=2919579 RepID=UPI001F0677D1|nr:response regulator [Nocardioides sp. CFH 31398]MCH1866900.1 response regulator [Nocardioides sp. CFH 31398]
MSCRVVVVDDAADLREMLTMVLDLRGGGDFEVVGEAGDGQQAVSVVEETQPDLVLMDIAMPVMDGLEAVPLVRRVSPDSTVVMLSGFPARTAEAGALEAGAHAYLEKGGRLAATLVPSLHDILSSQT